MENIYKVRIKSGRDAIGQYPSERRYSASTVLGLSSFHLFFSMLGLIFAILSIANVSKYEQMVTMDRLDSQPDEGEDVDNETDDNDTPYNDISPFYNYYSLASIMLSVGAILAGISGLIAWKQWYIDNNIKWFLLASSFSTFTSGVTIICTMITIIFFAQVQIPQYVKILRVIIGVSVHIVITALLEFICSLVSCTVAYAGVKAAYPDDIMVEPKGGRGKVTVNTVYKGNKKNMNITPPDILNHFQVAGKFSKYFPKKENGDLPKAESSAEYRERVDKFLEGQRIEDKASAPIPNKK